MVVATVAGLQVVAPVADELAVVATAVEGLVAAFVAAAIVVGGQVAVALVVVESVVVVLAVVALPLAGEHSYPPDLGTRTSAIVFRCTGPA